MLDLIFFAAIAIFLGYRLFNTLGKEDDSSIASARRNVVPIKDITPHGSRTSENEEDIYSKRFIVECKAIRKYDNSFELSDFLDGAEKAFEMIIKGYSEEDLTSIKTLLSPEIYTQFSHWIKARQEKGLDQDTTIIAVNAKEPLSIDIKGSKASITVKFITEQTIIMKNAEGDIIEGNPSDVQAITDVWTFSRNLSSSNPNWSLTKTQSLQ